MTRKTDEQMLIDKYGSKGELDAYTEYVTQGLSVSENKLISKYIKRGRILDLACGAGREAIALAKKGFEVVGIDIVPAMVLRAKENSKLHGVRDKTRFDVSDASALDFDDCSFDAAVYLGNAIEHTRGRTKRISMLREIGRVLKPQGILILTTHTRGYRFRYRLYWTFVNGFRVARKELTGRYGDMKPGDRYARHISNAKTKGKVFIHIYTYGEALEEIERGGFSLLEARCESEIENGKEDRKMRWMANQVLYVARKA
jgi:ubiquinone/menaquinone biosynthesis C-methylase UbiE